MNLTDYLKLLKHFDSILWGTKVTDTNWNFNGLMLDAYFSMSILSIDYLDIEDYFSNNGGFKFSETELLAEQFEGVNEEKRIKLIENILNVFKRSTYNKDVSEKVLSITIRFLERNSIVVNNPSNGFLQLSDNDIIGEGSYCVIKKKRGCIFRLIRTAKPEASGL
jgi:eukaryotic-like serine/threonine-protein kinase